MLTIAIVEPHTLYRLGLARLLADTLPSAKLLGMDYTSLETQAERQRCELLLLSVPSVKASYTLLSTAERRFQADAILLMADTPYALPSPHDSPAAVMGHLLKSASAELMIASVNLVLAGGTCFNYPGTEALQNLSSDGSRAFLPSKATIESFDSLVISSYQPTRWPPEDDSLSSSQVDEAQLLGITPRQYEVLVLLARGLTIKGIAFELDISAATAKAHAETLYIRMNVSNRNEAVYQAVAKGARLGIPTWED